MATGTGTRRGRVARGVAVGLGALAVVEVTAAVVFSAAVGWTWSVALDAFVVSNAVIGLASAVCGSILAHHRTANPIGWLFLVGGVSQTTASACAPLGAYLLEIDAPLVVLRIVLTGFVYSWPWAIGLCLPLALLLFPDGRPPSRRWRPVVLAVAVTAPLFSLEMGAAPEPVEAGLPLAYLTFPFYDQLAPLWRFAEVRGLVALSLGLFALVLRYRRGTETERRQLLWLMLAVLITLAAFAVWGMVGDAPIVVLFAIALVPIAVTVAIIRHQLLDIRLVVSRALSWTLLSLGVFVVYLVVVALLDRMVTAQLGRSALVTVLLVLVAAPVLPRLQRLVDRAMYGDRGNPARVVSQIGSQLASADADLHAVLGTVRSALRLPYAALEHDGVAVARDGTPPARCERWPLVYGDVDVGTLEVGLRPGERALSAGDRGVLEVLATPLAVVLRAISLSAELQVSRERIVAAQAEERRRLRRELHDGLGPTLTGLAFAADAAANLIDRDPARSAALLDDLRRDTRDALADVRRIVDDLRPPALDELGLVGALQQRADQLAWRSDGAAVDVRIDVPAEVPVLPAAVEVATYRIATEALTNVVRHSRASNALIRLQCGARLEVSVTDNGPVDQAWTPGVGLSAMRERAVELGGSFEAGPSPSGGRVIASFPLEAVR